MSDDTHIAVDGAMGRSMMICQELLAERRRQFAKWGEQDHDSLSPIAREARSGATFVYGLPSADDARRACQFNAGLGCCTWADIVMEELCEALDAPSESARRIELVQLAAVCVQWIDAIDRGVTA